VKPWFSRGLKALICALFADAVAHVTLAALPLMYDLVGLPLLLVPSLGMVRPGLAQPPPLCGDGERDKDMSLPADTGVPGMVERMRLAPALPKVLDVVPKSDGGICGALLVAEERRR